MSEHIGLIIGLLFFLVLIFGGSVLEFLDRRRRQKMLHEQEMARIAAGRKPTSPATMRKAMGEDGWEEDL